MEKSEEVGVGTPIFHNTLAQKPLKAFGKVSLQEINEMSMYEAALAYESMGFSLTPLKPHTKEAFQTGWNTPEYHCPAEFWKLAPNFNIGIRMGYSGLCALDIDDKKLFNDAMRAISHLLPATEDGSPFWEQPTAHICSGSENKDKLIFRVPAGITLPYRLLHHGKTHVFELRGDYKHQDVAPPSWHPKSGKQYQWVGEVIL